MADTAINRRALLAGTAAFTATALVPGIACSRPVQDGEADRKLLGLFDALFNEGVDESPEQAWSLGLRAG